MNKQQREDLAKLHKRLEDAKEVISQIHALIETERDSEQEKFDNMSEGLQQAEKGQKIENAATELSAATDSIESALESLDEAMTAIDNATAE